MPLKHAKWVLVLIGILLTLGSAGDNLPGLGAAAAGLFVSATLMHLYERWRRDSAAASDGPEATREAQPETDRD